jgi:transglutaminase-like putative cysteine protease
VENGREPFQKQALEQPVRIRTKNKLPLTWLLLTVWCFTAITSFGQTPEKDLANYSSKFTDENMVVLKQSETVNITYDKGELKITSKNYRERYFLNDNANMYAEKSLEYSGFNEISNIKARTLVPNKNKYKVMPVTEITTKDEFSAGIFYDDIKSKNFVYPALKKGVKTILEYDTYVKDARFFGSYYFDSPVGPVLHTEFTVTCPESVELEYKTFSVDQEKLEFTKTTDKGKTTYKWVMKDLKAMRDEPGTPGFRYIAPHMIIHVKKYTLNGKTTQVLANVDDLHNWYYNFVKNINKESSPALQAVVDSITNGATTDLEKVKRVFYWVQDNIKYIAFEDGFGGFIPRNAVDICEKKYGDCKDMSSIMHKMLELTDVQSHLTWIGTREIPYSYKEVPTPSVDNHMILTYFDGDQPYFIDGTGDFIEFGYPSSFIQGKEALVHIDSSNYKLIKVPEMDGTKNHMTDSVHIQFDGEARIVGSGKGTYQGYYKQTLNRNLINLTKDELLKGLTGFCEKGNNKFLLDSVREVNLGDRDKDLIINYYFNLRDYAHFNGDEIYINLHMDKAHLNDKIDNDRKYLIEKKFKSLESMHYSLDIPANFKVEYLPENSSFTSDQFGFNITYTVKGQQLYMDMEFSTNLLLLEKDHFEAWNKMIKKLNKAYKEAIILKRAA